MRSKIKVDPLKRIKMLLNGFHGESKIIYQLTDDNISSYLSDYRRLKSKFINKRYSYILNNKILFEQIFKNSIKVPDSLAIISKGRIVPRV